MDHSSRDFSLRSGPTLPVASIVALVAANLVPLAGVLFWGWDLLPVMALFWSENLVIGGFNVLRILLFRPDRPVPVAAKAFVVPFFCFHYGIFCMVHGVFVFSLFGGNRGFGFPSPLGEMRHLLAVDSSVSAAFLAIVASHGYSFIANYIGRGEYRRGTLQEIMGRPYGRVIVLHLAILVGGFVVMALGTPVAALAILVLLKIGVDVAAHRLEHKW